MPRRPIRPRVDADAPSARDDAEVALRDALARWASGVAVLALRTTDSGVQAMTVTAFLAISLRPPMIALAVGEHAPLATLLQPGTEIGVSILAAGQRRWANVFADTYATDRSGFAAEGAPVLADSSGTLVGEVISNEPTGDHRLVIATVGDARVGIDERPLLYHERRYRTLADD